MYRKDNNQALEKIDSTPEKTNWFSRIWGRLFPHQIVTRRRNEMEEEKKRLRQIEQDKHRLIQQSQTKLDHLQRYAKKFHLPILQEIYDNSKIVHDCIVENNIKIQRLEQFHLYYTDHFLALFEKIDKEFEEKNVLLKKRLSLIETEIQNIKKIKQRLADKIKGLQILRTEKKDYEHYIRDSINKLFDQFTLDQSRERQKTPIIEAWKTLQFNSEDEYIQWILMSPENVNYIRTLNLKENFTTRIFPSYGNLPIPIKFPCYMLQPPNYAATSIGTGQTYISVNNIEENKYINPQAYNQKLTQPPQDKWFDKYYKIGKYYFNKDLSKILYTDTVLASLQYVNSLGDDQIFRVIHRDNPILFILQRQKFILDFYTADISERNFDTEIKMVEMEMTPVNFELDKTEIEKEGLEQEKFNLSLDPETMTILDQYLTTIKNHKGEIDPQNIEVEKENLKKMLTLNVTNI
jgi:hypothetical protein